MITCLMNDHMLNVPIYHVDMYVYLSALLVAMDTIWRLEEGESELGEHTVT